jgi:ABC-type arginine transport system ATPase subunit
MILSIQLSMLRRAFRGLRKSLELFKMTREAPQAPLIVVLGATGTGKSQVRFRLILLDASNNPSSQWT